MGQLDTNILHFLEEYSQKGTADSLVASSPQEKTKDFKKRPADYKNTEILFCNSLGKWKVSLSSRV